MTIFRKYRHDEPDVINNIPVPRPPTSVQIRCEPKTAVVAESTAYGSYVWDEIQNDLGDVVVPSMNHHAVNVQLTFTGLLLEQFNGVPVTDWLWDFGDGHTASGKVVTHTYRAWSPTTVVHLRAIDSLGRTAGASMPVMLSKPSSAGGGDEGGGSSNFYESFASLAEYTPVDFAELGQGSTTYTSYFGTSGPSYNSAAFNIHDGKIDLPGADPSGGQTNFQFFANLNEVYSGGVPETINVLVRGKGELIVGITNAADGTYSQCIFATEPSNNIYTYAFGDTCVLLCSGDPDEFEIFTPSSHDRSVDYWYQVSWTAGHATASIFLSDPREGATAIGTQTAITNMEAPTGAVVAISRQGGGGFDSQRYTSDSARMIQEINDFWVYGS